MTVIGKIEYGLFYRQSTKLGSGYLLTVLIMDLMFTSLYVTVIHALSEQYSRTDMYSLKQWKGRYENYVKFFDLPGEQLFVVYLGFDWIFQFFICVWYSVIADTFPFLL